MWHWEDCSQPESSRSQLGGPKDNTCGTCGTLANLRADSCQLCGPQDDMCGTGGDCSQPESSYESARGHQDPPSLPAPPASTASL